MSCHANKQWLCWVLIFLFCNNCAIKAAINDTLDRKDIKEAARQAKIKDRFTDGRFFFFGFTTPKYHVLPISKAEIDWVPSTAWLTSAYSTLPGKEDTADVTRGFYPNFVTGGALIHKFLFLNYWSLSLVSPDLITARRYYVLQSSNGYRDIRGLTREDRVTGLQASIGRLFPIRKISSAMLIVGSKGVLLHSVHDEIHQIQGEYAWSGSADNGYQWKILADTVLNVRDFRKINTITDATLGYIIFPIKRPSNPKSTPIYLGSFISIPISNSSRLNFSLVLGIAF